MNWPMLKAANSSNIPNLNSISFQFHHFQLFLHMQLCMHAYYFLLTPNKENMPTNPTVPKDELDESDE